MIRALYNEPDAPCDCGMKAIRDFAWDESVPPILTDPANGPKATDAYTVRVRFKP